MYLSFSAVSASYGGPLSWGGLLHGRASLTVVISRCAWWVVVSWTTRAGRRVVGVTTWRRRALAIVILLVVWVTILLWRLAISVVVVPSIWRRISGRSRVSRGLQRRQLRRMTTRLRWRVAVNGIRGGAVVAGARIGARVTSWITRVGPRVGWLAVGAVGILNGGKCYWCSHVGSVVSVVVVSWVFGCSHGGKLVTTFVFSVCRRRPSSLLLCHALVAASPPGCRD